MKKTLPFLLLITLLVPAFTQGSYLPLGDEGYHYLDRMDIRFSKQLPDIHTGVKPIQRGFIGKYSEEMQFGNLDLNEEDKYGLLHQLRDNPEWLDSSDIKSKNPIWKVFYREPASLFSVKTKDFYLSVNPAIQFSPGYSFQDSGRFLIHNIRGLEWRATIKKHVSFYLFATDEIVKEPRYYDRKVENDTLDAVPAQGYYKTTARGGYNYFNARGSISFDFLKYFNVQLGHDKNFFGNGYRSLELSDNSAPYFFLKMQTRFWHVNYENVFAELTNQYDRGADRLLPKKYAAFHHLNVRITHWLNAGLFEGVIFNRDDHFELQYLNPLIFYRAIEHAVGSPDNVVMGLDVKANFARRFSAYGQFVLDDYNSSEKDKWWGNKNAWQLGLKYIDIANVAGLDGQIEFNTARPYTYTHIHAGSPLASYTHYNQALAHPLGANFNELILIARYKPMPKMLLTMKYFVMNYGADSSNYRTNWGSDIFRGSYDKTIERTYGNVTNQGIHTNINLLHLTGSYEFFHNCFADLQISYRSENSDIDARDNSAFFLYGGLRMNIPYRTNDF